MAKNFGLAIHGGAGTIRPQEMSSVKEKQYKEALEEAIQAGYDTLHHQGTAWMQLKKQYAFWKIALCLMLVVVLYSPQMRGTKWMPRSWMARHLKQELYH